MLKLNPSVCLVPLELQHASRMCEWMTAPELASNLGLWRSVSRETTEEWIKRALLSPSTRAFAILLGIDHVGNVVLDQIDCQLGSARISVYVGEASVRRQGVGTTGVYLGLKTAFLEEKLHKVWLTVHVRNHSAISIYSRLGFVAEGVLRDEFWLDGKRLDVIRMSVLSEEFAALQAVVNEIGAMAQPLGLNG